MYHKATFSGLYSNFSSFIFKKYKVGLIFTLLFRKFLIVLDFSRFHSEIFHLKEILEKNVFSIKLVNSCIKKFLNKRLTEKPITLAAEKNDLVIVLPFPDKLSLDLKTCLKNSISKNLTFY